MHHLTHATERAALALALILLLTSARISAQESPFASPLPESPGPLAADVLPPAEEARRMVAMMGGAVAVRAAAAEAAASASAADWAWSMRLTALLLALDGGDREALRIRGDAARALATQAATPDRREAYLAEVRATERSLQAPRPADGSVAAASAAEAAGGRHAAHAGPLSLPAADPWNIASNYASFALADASWTIDEDFPGTKLVFDGRYALRRGRGDPPSRDCDCQPRPTPQKMVGTVGAHLQWGEGEADIEYARLSLAALSYQWDYGPRSGRLRPYRDTLEWGVLQGGKDDPLGVDSYVELTLLRLARSWYYQSEGSPWLFTLGADLSGGYAWADSIDDTYQDVSNPVVGSSIRFGVSRSGWGQVYAEQRVNNGFTLSSPARGGAVSREARFRFGYLHRLHRCLTLDLFVEKRSFNFSDPDLPDLYTKSKRTGAALGCAF